MRIALVCFGTTGKGGMETVLTHVIKGLNARGVETKLFLLGGSIDESWLTPDLSYLRIGSISESRASRYLKYLLCFPYHLLKYRPDIILGADERAVYLGSILKRLLPFNVRVGSWIHFSLTTIDFSKLKAADFHIAISEGARQQFQQLQLAPAEKISRVHNPVELPTSLIPRPRGGALKLLYVGRLIYEGEKRVSDLLKALATVKGEWTLTVLGDGQDAASLQELAVRLGIDSRISWLGWREHPWDAVDEASVLVLTSDSEGFGMVLVEAMSRGIPCISSNCPTGPSEIVIEGLNGWLYPPRDVGELAFLLQTVVDNPQILPSAASVRSSIAKFESSYVLNSLISAFSRQLL